jgi:hypothetical protein
MYNFRYHLITIVAIFAALALGLLLGVAITGSDLVRDASSNLAESLTEQFDELRSQNEELSSQLEVESLLGSQLLGDWQSGRLEGRAIVVLTTADETGTALAAELGTLIAKSGGVPISIAVDPVDGFGLQDGTDVAALKALLPEVEDEDYEVTFARALAQEWTDLTPDGATHTRNTFEVAYPLTNQLVKSRHITVSVDYLPLLNALKAAETVEPLTGDDAPETEGGDEVETPDATTPETQRTSLQFAQQLKLPYGANGLIDASLLSIPESTQLRVDGVALQLALAFDEQGVAGELPYLLERRNATVPPDAEAVLPDIRENNYFALLVASPENADIMRRTAEDSGLSCVLDPLDRSGHFGIVALLSGADKGLYALDLSGIRPFPPLPADKTGNAAFVR